MPRTNKDEAPVLADVPLIQGAPKTTAQDLVGQLITFMETGTPPAGLFTSDLFCDSPCRSGGCRRRASRT
jgi:hypothetical protein